MSMDDIKTINQLGLDDWEREYLEPDNKEWSAIFFVEPFEQSGLGFDFFSLKAMGGVEYTNGAFDMHYEVIAHGSASWDGMRHLFFGHEKTGNYGYLFWPSKKELMWTLEMITKYGQKYCSDFEF